MSLCDSTPLQCQFSSYPLGNEYIRLLDAGASSELWQSKVNACYPVEDVHLLGYATSFSYYKAIPNCFLSCSFVLFYCLELRPSTTESKLCWNYNLWVCALFFITLRLYWRPLGNGTYDRSQAVIQWSNEVVLIHPPPSFRNKKPRCRCLKWNAFQIRRSVDEYAYSVFISISLLVKCLCSMVYRLHIRMNRSYKISKHKQSVYFVIIWKKTV